MAMASTSEHETSSIEANIVYTARDTERPVDETFGSNAMPSRREGSTEEHRMTIRDGRPLRDRFKLEEHGFEFIDHKTAVTDFYDEDQLRSVYYPEIEQIVKDRTGASRVVIFDHTLRAADEAMRETTVARQTVKLAHNDYTEWSGPQRVRDILPEAEAESLLQKRFAIVQVWRAIRDPIETDPLAIAEAGTLSPDDLITAERRYPNRVGETYRIAHNPAHRWFYFPRMQRDEALVFKVFDTKDDGNARFTAHTSFVDPTSPPDARPRESIEMRTFAFFDD
jgi:hypothetical protein